jgi:hypothetical protein
MCIVGEGFKASRPGLKKTLPRFFTGSKQVGLQIGLGTGVAGVLSHGGRVYTITNKAIKLQIKYNNQNPLIFRWLGVIPLSLILHNPHRELSEV